MTRPNRTNADEAPGQVLSCSPRRAELAATLAALAELRERFALLERAAAEPDPRASLREIATLGGRLRELEARQVRAALERGFSYRDIAAELGVTRQSVHQKHTRRTSSPTHRSTSATTRTISPGNRPGVAGATH